MAGMLRKRRAGFTLIELLVVMVILVLLAGLVAPRFLGRTKEARRKKAIADIASIGDALDLYSFDAGRYPTTQQGLKALLEEPTTSPKPRSWKGPYLKQTADIPVDPWGTEYQYESPGKHSEDYDLWSYGADGKEGGDDLDADIQSWDLPAQ
ncbi:MAG: type II secretion system major pseudopilin GspG [Armatimonadota bacterium]